jgi:SAM-dependent methyltransferase
MPIKKKIRSTEYSLDVVDLTIQYGLQSFKYGTSDFIAEIEKHVQLSKEDVLFDLGSGYGEPLFYLAEKFKQAKFVGIEIVKEWFDIAARECRSRRFDNIQFIHGDILKEDLSAGTVFYIFNPLFGFQYPILARRLREVAQSKKIIVIAESKACYYFSRLRWLSGIQYLKNDGLSSMKIYESK